MTDEEIILAEIFKAAWNAANDRREFCSRTVQGIRAVLAYQTLSGDLFAH